MQETDDPQFERRENLRAGTYFSEVEPNRHYLVCDDCMLYLFLGESEA
jgi:hypothetical protein